MNTHYTLHETHLSGPRTARSYDVLDSTGTVAARILSPGHGNPRYGLYLPATSADGSPCYRIQGAYPGTWYATAEEALAAMPQAATEDTPHDPEAFLAYAVTLARQNMQYGADVRQAAREALQEAHSTLSQQTFFATLDALGGRQGAIAQIARATQETAPETPLMRLTIKADTA